MSTNEPYEPEKEEGTNRPEATIMWMMLICCGLPMLLFALLPALGLRGGADFSWWIVGAIAILALCVLSMRGHGRQRS